MPDALELREEVAQRVDGDDRRRGEPGGQGVYRPGDRRAQLRREVRLLHEVDASPLQLVDVYGEAGLVRDRVPRPYLVVDNVVLRHHATPRGLERYGLQHTRRPAGTVPAQALLEQLPIA